VAGDHTHRQEAKHQENLQLPLSRSKLKFQQARFMALSVRRNIQRVVLDTYGN
jgi:hypothetical protein